MPGTHYNGGPDAPERFVEIQDIVDPAKMYALIALDICGS